MNKESLPQTVLEQVNDQVDQYLVDNTIHQGGSAYGDVRSEGIQGGEVTRQVVEPGRIGESTVRLIKAEGEVNGQHLKSAVNTSTYSESASLNIAKTSDDKAFYAATRTAAHVDRETGNGESYRHNFKNPKKAAELITRLASKRAAKIVDSKRDNKVMQ